MHKTTITAVVIMIVFSISALLVLDTRTNNGALKSDKVGTPSVEVVKLNDSGDVKRGYIESVPSPTSSPAESVTPTQTPAKTQRATNSETKIVAQTSPTIVAETKHTINMTDYAYQPMKLTIKKGDSVTWVNRDLASHTVTSESGIELASEYLKTGESYAHTFGTSGTFSYYCQPHPYMKGTVGVE